MDQSNAISSTELDFEILEMSEVTALEEMGASSTIASSSTCAKQPVKSPTAG